MKKWMVILLGLFGLTTSAYADLDASNTQVNTAAMRLSLNAIAGSATDTAAIRLSLDTVSGVKADTAALRLSLNTVNSLQSLA